MTHHARPNDGTAVCLSDFVSRRELHRLDIYHEFFKPLGTEFQTVITVPASGSKPIGLPFNRETRDFSAREELLLDTIRPHLVALYRHVRARERLHQALERRAVATDRLRCPRAA